jgi:hypothetical protein
MLMDYLQFYVPPKNFPRLRFYVPHKNFSRFDLIIYSFTSHSRIFHLYGDVTIAGEGLQNLGLCSALGAFEQGGTFILPHLLWHGAILSHPKDRPIQSPLTTHEGMWRIYTNPDPHGVTYGDVTIADEGLQKLSLWSAHRIPEQEGIFIVPHKRHIWRTAPFRRLLGHTKGCGGCILTRILDWLIIHGFKNFSLIWRRHHCRWRAKNLGLCSALKAFEQGGIFVVPHLLCNGTSVFPVSSEGPPHSVAFYDTQGDVEDLLMLYTYAYICYSKFVKPVNL